METKEEILAIPTEINKIVVIFSDNDFINTFHWIGKILLETINSKNITGCKVLETTEDIEKFVYSLLPTAIEFLQYRTDKYANLHPFFIRYRNIEKEELDKLVDFKLKFIYNINDIELNEYSGEHEILVVDLMKKESFTI